MSSRPTKKKIQKLKGMTNGEWLNMLNKMDLIEVVVFGEWCHKYGLGDRYDYYKQIRQPGRKIK